MVTLSSKEFTILYVFFAAYSYSFCETPLICQYFNQGCGTGALELGILSGAGAQIKNQKPELSLKVRTRVGAIAIWKILWVTTPYCNNGSASLWCLTVFLKNRFVCGIVVGRVSVTCGTMILKHCSKSRMQLSSILCAALSSLTITPLILCVTDFINAIKENVSLDLY